MNNAEYDIMDQLYFVTSYEDVKELSGVEEPILPSVLWEFIKKDWVKCFDGPVKEVEVVEEDFKTNFANYHYLASKQGMLAHNMR